MIEIVTANNIEEVLPLIRQYQEFYNVKEISDAKNQEFFAQFGESSPLGCQFLFRQQFEVVGFATVYFSFASTIASKIAILNDLYTVPAFRGKGVGRSLIEYCRNFANLNDSVRLQWQTTSDNYDAQSLYDSIETEKSAWYLYVYKVQ
ncbi:MAG: GNAT family N-acetyltransferase [Pseudomonadales bacterium]|nr:GNAT family N-acetyltransferase [Pseudomonadales bacterium]